jgi:hypothetical protein
MVCSFADAFISETGDGPRDGAKVNPAGKACSENPMASHAEATFRSASDASHQLDQITRLVNRTGLRR